MNIGIHLRNSYIKEATAACALAAALAAMSIPAAAAQPLTVTLPPAPGPLANPLKGWCTYTSAGAIRQPYSMVYEYVSWKDLEPVNGQYRFDEWERKAWDVPAAKGKQVVFRVWIDYPSLPSGLPDWLRAEGVKTTHYTDYGGGESPDYSNPRFQAALLRFIAALGRRYDHDPRVAFIALGTLGHWGEWHTYPRPELFASDDMQRKVIDAYHAAFPDKILMARYAGGYAGQQAWLGYHDDMFPSDTDGSTNWQFLPKMRASGRTKNWLHAAVGGEMEPGNAIHWMGTDLPVTWRALEGAHFTWIGPYSPAIDATASTGAELANSQAMVRRMGYQFCLQTVACSSHIAPSGVLRVSLTGDNQGVAPFYYAWPVRVALLNASGRVVKQAQAPTDVRSWQPGQFRFSASLPAPAQPGQYRLAVSIHNPYSGGPILRFANALPTSGEWTCLTSVQVSASK